MADELKTLKRKRGVIKAKITKAFNNFDEQEGEVLSSANLKDFIMDRLVDIGKFDESILDHYGNILDNVVDGEIQALYDDEVDDQAQYTLDVRSKLERLCAVDVTNRQPSCPVTSDCNLKLPELKCDLFHGEGSTNLEYFSFMSKFNNIVGLRPNLSNSTKFTYLKTYLRGYALKLVQHLSVTDSNYLEAIELLEAEFLNVPALIDESVC